jgi:thiamine-phosphate pyrophosphorylase
MRRLELSPAVEVALARASSLARRAGTPSIEPRHVLCSLLAEAEGKAALLLAQAGVAASMLRLLGGLDKETPAQDRQPLPLQETSQAALTRALRLAAHHSEDGTVTSDQVLLAVLEHAPELRGELESGGLQFADLQAKIAVEAPPLPIAEELFPAERTEPVDTARILDANGNRAREALRVLEDHSRFVLGDAFLAGQLKQLRHDLTAALSALPTDLLLQARDTEHDVGTAVSTAAEWDRPDVAAVVTANAKRLQEALRSLEEYGKVVSADLGQRLEQLRYRSYTLERALVVGARARERLAAAVLYVLVTDSLCRASLAGTVREALRGGADVIQLRDKDADDRTLLAQARELRKMTRDAGALFIVNDRPDMAILADADGVHLGQEDLPVREARRLLGAEALIGVSTHNVEQVRRAVLDGASYIGVGPTFPSQTKEFAALAGLDFVRQACAETTLPAFALGGIGLDNLQRVLDAGARRIAVSHAICAADDAQAAARQLRATLTAGAERAE